MVVVYFLIAFFLTFFIARIIAHVFHDRDFYGTPMESSKTITGWLRRRTNLDIHHYHFGLFFIFLGLLFGLIFSFNWINAAFLGVGLSLFLDQVPYLITFDGSFFQRGYFSIKNILISLLLHLVIGIISLQYLR